MTNEEIQGVSNSIIDLKESFAEAFEKFCQSLPQEIRKKIKVGKRSTTGLLDLKVIKRAEKK